MNADAECRPRVLHGGARRGGRYVLIVASLLVAGSQCSGLRAAGLPGTGEPSVSDPLSVPAKQWADDAAANEIKVIQYGKPFLRYRIHRVDLKGDQLRDVIESRDGPVARLIMRDNRPLSTEEDTAERERLNDMLNSPAAYARHVKTDAGEKKMGIDMIRLLPAAMIYTYTPGQPQRAGRPSGEDDPPEIVIDYKPDPAWVPPTLYADALTGVQGRVWIDARTHYLVRLEGAIFRPVNFGFGIFARLYPGGQLSLDQTKALDQRWIFSHFVQHLTVRALLVKTIKQDADVAGLDFTPVAEMSYQDAIHVLLSTPLPTH